MLSPKKRNILAMPIGPVEPGPPAVTCTRSFANVSRVCDSSAVCLARAICLLQAREVWIEGSASVGSCVTGRIYYFGGTEVR